MLLLGAIIMIGRIILAFLLASVNVNTCNVRRTGQPCLGRIDIIAAQQADGASEQVWAVNAIKKALQIQ